MISLKKLLELVRKKSITFSVGLLLVLVLVNTGFLIHNNMVLKRTTVTQKQTQEIKSLTILLWNDVVRNLDMGVRGYALTKEEQMLIPYNNGLKTYDTIQSQLYTMLKEQGYPNERGFLLVKKGYDDYIEITAKMLELVKMDSLQQFKEELKQDRGLTLWKVYEKYSGEVKAYQDKLYNDATEEYQAANTRMSFIQIFPADLQVSC